MPVKNIVIWGVADVAIFNQLEILVETEVVSVHSKLIIYDFLVINCFLTMSFKISK